MTALQGVGPTVLVTGFALILRRLAARGARRHGLTLGGPAATAALAALATACVLASGRTPSPPLLSALAAASVSALTDCEAGMIFDEVSGAALAVAFAAALASGTFTGTAAGALAVAGALALPHVATRGAGLGLGDVKLGATIGAGLGAGDGIACVGVAFVLGAAYGMALIVGGRAHRRTALRFGPFLGAGLLAVGVHPCFP